MNARQTPEAVTCAHHVMPCESLAHTISRLYLLLRQDTLAYRSEHTYLMKAAAVSSNLLRDQSRAPAGASHNGNTSHYCPAASVTFCCAFAQVLVVANPANTNALILKENAPSIPAEDITCLTRLDHNRALGQVHPLDIQEPGSISDASGKIGQAPCKPAVLYLSQLCQLPGPAA